VITAPIKASTRVGEVGSDEVWKWHVAEMVRCLHHIGNRLAWAASSVASALPQISTEPTFVAVLRNRAEIVLAHANRESPRSAALISRGQSRGRQQCRLLAAAPQRHRPSPMRMRHARPLGLHRQKAATQPATHAARRTEHDLDLCNLGVPRSADDYFRDHFNFDDSSGSVIGFLGPE
jgi:hypothetical protein